MMGNDTSYIRRIVVQMHDLQIQDIYCNSINFKYMICINIVTIVQQVAGDSESRIYYIV